VSDSYNNGPVTPGGQNSALATTIAALNEAFAGLPHTMFCIKDTDGRYLAINGAFADRAGRTSNHVLGRTARDVFPPDLVETYELQDAQLLATGEPIRNELEMILRPDGTRGWYVTSKSLLRDELGTVAGIVVVSQDLHTGVQSSGRHHTGLQAAVDLVRTRFHEPLRVAELAAAAELTSSQLERATRRALGVSPKQLIIRTRIDEAARRLDDTELSLAAIAGECGFYDQSSFTRQFQRVVGITPGAYRARRMPVPDGRR
jgi:PAS domain S-box-containing protein